MKQKLVVFGATGFIGRNMVQYFSELGLYDVHAVRFQREAYAHKNVTWHQADLRQLSEVEAVIEGADIIIQAAATTSGAQDIVNQPYIHVTDNAVMNSYIFQLAFKHQVKHVLFFSCTVMYPTSEQLLTEQDCDENKPLHPRYFGVGHTKLYLEKMCDFYSRLGTTKFTAIRHSNIYGPFDKYDLKRSHFFGASITKVMQAQRSITVWGTGEEKRDLLHIDDLCYFVKRAIQHQNQAYRLYNCGLGKAYAVKNVIHKIIHASGKKLDIKHDVSKPSIKTSLALDCTLAYQELGWQPQIGLEEGISKTIAWFTSHIDTDTLELKKLRTTYELL